MDGLPPDPKTHWTTIHGVYKVVEMDDDHLRNALRAVLSQPATELVRRMPVDTPTMPQEEPARVEAMRTHAFPAYPALLAEARKRGVWPPEVPTEREMLQKERCVKVVCTRCSGRGRETVSCMGPSDNMDVGWWEEDCSTCKTRGWVWAVPMAHFVVYGEDILVLDER